MTTTPTAFKTAVSTAASIAILSSLSLGADQPASFDGLQLPLDAIGMLEVPGPDYPRLWAEDDLNDHKGGAMRIAVPNDVSATPLTHGTWERMPNGRLLWRLIVTAPESKHVNVAFEDWHLPASGEAWISSIDGRYILNRITPADNVNDGELWSALVFSDTAVIEISVDAHERNELIENTTLTKVNAGYRGFGVDETRGSSESCNIDVECPLGDDWWNEIPAAGVYTINGSLTCSGSMINNTANDETPYFFTADHCGISTGNDQSVVVYWNHQNSTCRTGGASGNNGNGQYNQYTSGSTWLADNSNTDYTLIRLNSDPNPSYGVTFAGWNRSSSTPTAGGVSIHHPNCAEKRISSVQTVYGNGPYWGVNWDQGRTYYGSSGSPLFNGNHQIVGSLCCGSSFCTNDSDDFYGRSISQSWSGMSSYLDPTGSGVISCDTLNPYGDGGGGSGACCTTNGTCVPNTNQNTCDTVGGTFYPGTACADVTCGDTDPTGACCLTSGSCIADVTSEACNSAGGDYQGDNSNCGSVTCEQPDPTGACCFSSGNCSGDLTSADCSNAGGTYQGDDSSCDDVSCDSVDIVTFHHAIVGSGMLSIDQPNWTVDIYVEVEPGSRVDAVAGNTAQQKMLTSTYGFYQDSYGGPTSAEINPTFYDFVPDLEWDSRVTIGAIDQTGNPFDANNVQSVGIDWTQFEQGNDLAVNDGTWFILPDEDQGNAQLFTAQDCSQQTGVLVARLTALELDSTIMFEALIQGRDGGGNTWQDTASYSFNYTATEDCNGNLISDTCDIANGTSEDANGDGIPDECGEACPGDADGDGDSDVDDILAVLGDFGATGGGLDGDVDNDNDVDVDDLLQVLGYFGSC
ncbi:MAG: serine protease [Phycisphaerales bacterium]|nr:serine protease [Phycisphaerales bacterium]